MAKKDTQNVRWHRANADFVDCEVIEDFHVEKGTYDGKLIKDPVKIKVGNKTHVVPAYQLYDWVRTLPGVSVEKDALPDQSSEGNDEVEIIKI